MNSSGWENEVKTREEEARHQKILTELKFTSCVWDIGSPVPEAVKPLMDAKSITPIHVAIMSQPFFNGKQAHKYYHENIKDRITYWIMRQPSNWWQFWLPQSGFLGGVITTTLIAIIFFLSVFILGVIL